MRKQIDLTKRDISALKKCAEYRNQKLKPFLESILKYYAENFRIKDKSQKELLKQKKP